MKSVERMNLHEILVKPIKLKIADSNPLPRLRSALSWQKLITLHFSSHNIIPITKLQTSVSVISLEVFIKSTLFCRHYHVTKTYPSYHPHTCFTKSQSTMPTALTIFTENFTLNKHLLLSSPSDLVFNYCALIYS